MAEELERTYVIPLRKVKNVKRTIRAPRAIREVQNFLMKHSYETMIRPMNFIPKIKCTIEKSR